jgi:hypothetical protein
LALDGPIPVTVAAPGMSRRTLRKVASKVHNAVANCLLKGALAPHLRRFRQRKLALHS